MKFRLFAAAAALLALAGLAAAGPCHSPTYYPPAYHAPAYHVPSVVEEVEFSFAHPVYNQVEVVAIKQKQVFIPTVVTGQAITQTEVVTVDRVLAQVQSHNKTAVRLYRK